MRYQILDSESDGGNQGDFRRKNFWAELGLKRLVSCSDPDAAAKLVLTLTQTTRSDEDCKIHG